MAIFFRRCLMHHAPGSKERPKSDFEKRKRKSKIIFPITRKKREAGSLFLQPLEEEERKVRRIHQSSDLRREGEKNLSPILRGEWGTEYISTDCFWPLPSFTNPALMQQVSIVRG